MDTSKEWEKLRKMKIALQEYNEIINTIGNLYHEAALRLHLTDSELDILYGLCSHEPGCYQSTLYKETGQTKSTINSAIKKMERNEILYLTPGPGRNTCVYLTEKGKRLVTDTVCKLMELESQIFESWSEDDRRLFLKLNRDYAEKLDRLIKTL